MELKIEKIIGIPENSQYLLVFELDLEVRELKMAKQKFGLNGNL